jgi:hypothetical protein
MMPAAFGWILPLGGLALIFAGGVLSQDRVVRARRDAEVAGWEALARRSDLQWRGDHQD